MNVYRVKKCLAAKIPWQYKNGILVFSDGQFKSCIILDNNSPTQRKEIFELLNMPVDYNYYSDSEVKDAMSELYLNAVVSNTYKAKVPAYRVAPISGLERRSRLIQLYISKLYEMDRKKLKRNAPKVIEVHTRLKQFDWTKAVDTELQEDKLIKIVRKHFSSVIKFDKDSCYDIHLEAFIVALKDYQQNKYNIMANTESNKETIFIKCKGIRSNAIMQYSPVLDEAIANWDGIGTVRRIGDKVFVKKCSIHYFIELVMRKANVCVTTELYEPKKKK